jgi:hypothetical protein
MKSAKVTREFLLRQVRDAIAKNETAKTMEKEMRAEVRKFHRAWPHGMTVGVKNVEKFRKSFMLLAWWLRDYAAPDHELKKKDAVLGPLTQELFEMMRRYNEVVGRYNNARLAEETRLIEIVVGGAK